ncbi:MAG: VOC family protein [Acidimicrobiales bacterium]
MPIRWLAAFFDLPAEALPTSCTFWQRVTGSTLSPPRGSRAEFATLIPEGGDAFLRVQRVDGRGSGYHLDVHVDEVDTVVSQALSLSATAADGPSPVPVLRSPAGLTFCVVGHQGEDRRPPPLAWPAGHRSLVDQVCVGIPPQVFDDECDFWEALTGWEHRTGSRPEVRYLARPPRMPLRILLQRLDDQNVDTATGHLDLATSDATLERQRHTALGTTVLAEFPDWTTLRDPNGLAYCITRRNPDTGTL